MELLKQLAASFVRHALTAAGGALVAKGVVDADAAGQLVQSSDAIAGVLVGGAGLGLSALQKVFAAKVAKAA